MFDFMFALLAGLSTFFRSRADVALEILALRQQVTLLKRKRPRPAIEPGRPAVLGLAAAILVRVEERLDRRQT